MNKKNKVNKNEPELGAIEIISDVESVEKKLKTIDRLINWDNSLTSREKFKEILLSGKQLRIKFGADITSGTLHIGHAVNLRIMRHLQDLGHKVVFLLGGFTTLVGDPTDKLKVRTFQKKGNIEENKKKFIDQIKFIIRFDDDNLIEIRDNSEWWGTLEKHGSIKISEFFEMLKKLTVSLLFSRDMFKKRTELGSHIYVSEFLYPILQGYDSVEINSDLTVVGSDQMFNEKIAWIFQEEANQQKQAILCTKITPGIDGKEKQSKTLGNYVGLAHSPKEKFNRVMLLPDELITEWFEVYTEIDQNKINDLKKEYLGNAIGLKKQLAFYITEMFHGEEEAILAEKDFSEKKILNRIPAELKEIKVGDLYNLDQLLRENLNLKTNNIKDLIIRKNLSIIIKINKDGTYKEKLFLDIYQAKDYTIKIGDIIRMGKNKFYRLT